LQGSQSFFCSVWLIQGGIDSRSLMLIMIIRSVYICTVTWLLWYLTNEYLWWFLSLHFWTVNFLYKYQNESDGDLRLLIPKQTEKSSWHCLAYFWIPSNLKARSIKIPPHFLIGSSKSKTNPLNL
jgi:hypothetical protein